MSEKIIFENKKILITNVSISVDHVRYILSSVSEIKKTRSAVSGPGCLLIVSLLFSNYFWFSLLRNIGSVFDGNFKIAVSFGIFSVINFFLWRKFILCKVQYCYKIKITTDSGEKTIFEDADEDLVLRVERHIVDALAAIKR